MSARITAITLWTLAWRSAWNRRFVLSLTALSVALSTFLLLSIERIRADTEASFSQAVSGTDLIVGARSGSLQLLLYSVFRVGQPSNNIRLDSLQVLERHRAVAWVVPLSLGDSHRGYPVVATVTGYFDHFRYGDQQPLRLAHGQRFAGLHDAVIGAEVARRLGYGLGTSLILSHGDGALADNDHVEHPFQVVGVLAPTGTPVDRSIHISLEAMDALHQGPDMGLGMQAFGFSPPREVTAALVGLKSRTAVFSVQRAVASYRAEPLMAILPGVVLDEMWQVLGAGERTLQLISALVAAVSVLGLVAVILAGLDSRRRELAVLRAVGAGPRQVWALLALEGALVVACGVLLGTLLQVGSAWALADLVLLHAGVVLQPWAWGTAQWTVVGSVLLAGGLACLWPGWRAYRWALADGLTPRV
ncbi:MAG: ABC transporter permease [Aquabacterium sp.]|jgi:putative ABC transport system permease protein